MPEKTIPRSASSYKIPYIILYITEILLTLLLIPGCFKAPSLTASFDGSDFTYQETESGIVKYIGNGFELTPGVYQINARRNEDYYQNFFCEDITNAAQSEVLNEVFISTTFDISLECEDKTFRSLRGNTVRFNDGQEAVTFEYYVFDKLKDVRLNCVPENVYVNINEIGQIDIYKTSAGNRIALVCILSFIIILNGLLRFRRRILKGQISPARMAAFWGLAGTAAIALFPNLVDYLIMGTDSSLYLLKIETLAQNPENILQCIAQGSILLYIPAMFRNIGFSVMTSYKLFIALITISAVFISYRSIMNCVANESAALLGSMAYILFPWSIDLLYTDGSVGCYIMFASFPLVYSCLWKVIRRDTLTVSSRSKARSLWQNLCCAAIGALFMFQGIMLDKTLSAEVLNVAKLLPVLLPAALSVLLCTLYIKLKRHRKEFFFIMAVFLLISAVYRVNEIAFCSNVYYLYDIGQLKRGVQP